MVLEDRDSDDTLERKRSSPILVPRRSSSCKNETSSTAEDSCGIFLDDAQSRAEKEGHDIHSSFSSTVGEDAHGMSSSFPSARRYFFETSDSVARLSSSSTVLGERDFSASLSHSPSLASTPRQRGGGALTPQLASSNDQCEPVPAMRPPTAEVEEAAGNPQDSTSQAPSVTDKRWILGKQYPIVSDKLYFMSLRDEAKLKELEEWQTRKGLESDRTFFNVKFLQYFPFCADFGPLNIGCIYRFSQMMKKLLEQQEIDHKKLVLYTSADPQTRTNVACLMASWLVLSLGWTAENAWVPFQFTGKYPFVAFRDASFEPVTFQLYVQDVLAGLYRAKQCKILSLDDFDIDWYDYCDHPASADLHTVVPGVFAAFKGPKSIGTHNDDSGIVDLTPEHYVQIFDKLGVTGVVRLNSKQYDEGVFIRAGFRHDDLYFDDCSTPDEDVLVRWFKICRERSGLLAVHCKAGLGRTGTLLCVWLMRKYRFTGREVIGYCRVMRPGSILGPQQEFLENNQELFWAMGDPDTCNEDLLLANSAPTKSDDERQKISQESSRRAHENTEAMRRRTAARICSRS